MLICTGVRAGGGPYRYSGANSALAVDRNKSATAALAMGFNISLCFGLDVLVHDPTHGRERCPVARAVAQANLPAHLIELEPRLRPQMELRNPLGADALPFQLDGRKAVADAIHCAEDDIFQVIDGVAKDVFHRGRSLFFSAARVGRRLDVPIHAQRCSLALVVLAAQVRVALEHVFDELVLRQDIAQVGTS